MKRFSSIIIALVLISVDLNAQDIYPLRLSDSAAKLGSMTVLKCFENSPNVLFLKLDSNQNQCYAFVFAWETFMHKHFHRFIDGGEIFSV